MIITIDTETGTVKTDRPQQLTNMDQAHPDRQVTTNEMTDMLAIYDAYETINDAAKKISEVLDDLARIGDLINHYSSLYDKNRSLDEQEHTRILRNSGLTREERAQLLLHGK